MALYRKLPVEVEAFQYHGVIDEELPKWFMDAINERKVLVYHHGGVTIQTKEGSMFAGIGDYIIKGIKGELYPCKPDIFEMTYEKLA